MVMGVFLKRNGARLLIGAVIWWASAQASFGQVVLDGTLGPAGPLSGPDYDISSDLGRQVGGNLFHSFGQFDVGTGESATFSGPDSVSNVIGRVTGGLASSIDGTIRSTIPGADLFLINPAGMVFGPNASLDVRGAFHASTANEIRFPDGGVFSASDPANTVLTTAPPAAFGFLDANPASLRVEGSILSAPEDTGLSLVGGDILVANGTVEAPGGRLELTSLGGPGAVPIGSDDFDTASFDRLGTITLSGFSDVRSSSATGSGPLFIRGGNLVIVDSRVFSFNLGVEDSQAVVVDLSGDLTLSGGIVGSFAGGGGAGADLTIRAASVTVSNGAGIGTISFTGPGGDLDIAVTGDIIVTGQTSDSRSNIFADADDSGPAGDARISAATLLVSDGARLFKSGFGTGDAGSLEIEVGTLAIVDGGRLRADALGEGRGARVTITASELVTVGGRVPADGRSSRIAADSETTQNPSSLTIIAPIIEVTDGARIRSNTFGTGRSGSITIVASERILVSGRNDATGRGSISTETIGAGPGGDIFITAPLIQLQNSALIVADSFGAGPAGNIDLQVGQLELSVGGIVSSGAHDSGDGGRINIVADDITIVGGLGTDGRIAGINGSSTPPAPGQPAGSGEASGRGGTIEIVANSLSVSDGGFVSSGARDTGDGGAVRISLTGELNVSGIGITGERSVIASTARAAGDGGSIAIDAGLIRLSDGGVISADTSAAGNAGNIEVIAGQLSLEQASITSRSTSSGADAGTAGSIVISVGNLRVRDSSEISTSTDLADGGDISIEIRESGLIRRGAVTTSVGAGEGAGGNIAINAGVLALDSGTIQANALGGPGGNIVIVTDSLIASADSVIEASSALGVSGTISIESPDVDLTSSVTLLPGTLADVAAQLAAQCEARGGKTLASFVGVGRGGLPLQPTGGHLAYYLADQVPDHDVKETAVPPARAIAFIPVTFKIDCES